MLKKLARDFLAERLGIDWRIAVLTIASTILIMVDYYFNLLPGNHFDSILLYILVPLAITVVIFRGHPADYGFRLGNWKAGIAISLIGIAALAPVIWFLGRHSESMQVYYRFRVDGLVWKKALELFGWEYLFRGWLLFGYARKYGPEALWLQAVPFAVAHLGKPAVETLTTIFGGFAFGYVAWKTDSFLYPFLIHWFISVFIVLAATGALG